MKHAVRALLVLALTLTALAATAEGPRFPRNSSPVKGKRPPLVTQPTGTGLTPTTWGFASSYSGTLYGTGYYAFKVNATFGGLNSMSGRGGRSGAAAGRRASGRLVAAGGTLRRARHRWRASQAAGRRAREHADHLPGDPDPTEARQRQSALLLDSAAGKDKLYFSHGAVAAASDSLRELNFEARLLVRDKLKADQLARIAGIQPQFFSARWFKASAVPVLEGKVAADEE